ncbi:dihydrofolate reductase family protein [Vibrio mimicus]|uniref:dihydrofolate reductase family protein n=1 Tax=Vibrio TaxID=662 RepID=UPI000892A799|nr:dihydrofolate reductase family protein [Vibrio cholerae]EGR2590827.1 dihydrofolate reductase [Vibrio cholerae]OFI67272.1 diacylglycerol kinase [Vibrio cholerae]OFJ35086.1 diacylglycerol kinase [Vibrio cholerae]
MKVSAYIGQSIDGYIAGINGELDWMQDVSNPEGSDFGFSEFMSTVDALLMGRNTFEKVASFGFWPYNKPVYVASNSLRMLPAEFEDKASLISGSVKEMLDALSSRGIKTVYIDGGLLIQSALRAKVLTEITITTLPTILGSGIKLFGHLDNSVKLRLVSSEIVVGQMVKTHYTVAST